MRDHETSKYRGSCLCGAITYEASNLEKRAGHCHCSMCRKFHGAAFATLAGLSRNDLHWLSGESMLQRYTAGNKTVRQFCSKCGSSLTFEMSSAPNTIELAVSTLDDPIPFEPDVHIYTDFGANWYEINDGLPCFSEGRDSEQTKQE